MTENYIDIGMNVVVIIASLLSIIYTLGVVWRVEKKLDISYKLFLVAILAFTAEIIIELINPLDQWLFNLSASIMRVIFAIFFLAGVYTMRDMIRRIDGEKKNFEFPDKPRSSTPV
jgi:hypothetical protein